MKKNERSFRHEKIVYDRPAEPFRCGRASLWRKPCWQGPDAAGGCQGRAECAPVRIGDRWECRRPKVAGGKCDEGPRPDGTCAHCHPPCQPQRGLRQWRGRLVGLSLLLVLVAFLVGIDPTARSVISPLAVDAGELASSHAGFTRDRGCGACHAAHREDGLAWLAAVFRDNDVTPQCLECHDFAGPPALAHNAKFEKHPEAGNVPCARCHQEHQGAAAHLRQVPDYACGNCHEKRFESFAGGHPAFPENYPYVKPGRIYFDHGRHIAKHFADPKVLARSKAVAEFAGAAKAGCTACHAVEGATREVAPMPYEKICGACHDKEIKSGELTVFEPAQMTYPASVLLGLEKDGDEAESAKRLAELWRALAQKGEAAIGEAAGDAAKGLKAEGLSAGLPGTLARELGAAWAAKRGASGGAKSESPGWGARDNAEGRPALVYVPTGHADPVLKAWLELAAATAKGPDKARAQVASDALEQMLDKDAAGSCGKCHGAALRAAAPGTAARAWKRTPLDASPYSRYSHAPHLELVHPEAGCKACHELNAESGYAKYFNAKPGKPVAYQSNFLGIRKGACVECHQPGQVNSACQTCHAYHLKHRFNLGFRTRGAQKDETPSR